MLKQIARLRVGLIFLFGILMFYSSAFAMEVLPSRQDNRRDNRGDRRGYNRRDRHYYRNGRWYKHDLRGKEITVTVLSIGALIESLPPSHATIVVENTPYYHDDRYYYRQHSDGGYVVVSPPRIVQSHPGSNYDERRDRGGNSHNEENRGENR